MTLYPLGTQRDLDEEFDKVDFYGLHWGEGRMRSNKESNRRYNGLYMVKAGNTIVLYYYEFCTSINSGEQERILNKGYKRQDIREGKQHPLYLCRAEYIVEYGRYRKVEEERTLLHASVAKILLKEYLDPYYFKTNQALKDYFKTKKE